MAESIPQLLTLGQLAKLLALSPHTVRKLVKSGRLRPTRVCRKLLFRPDEVLRFLAETK